MSIIAAALVAVSIPWHAVYTLHLHAASERFWLDLTGSAAMFQGFNEFGRRFCAVFFCALVGVNASSAACQAPADAETKLNLSSAIDLALHANRATLAEADASVAKAQINAKQAQAATSFEVHGQFDVREVRVDLRALGLVLPVFPLTTPVTYVGADGPYGVLDPRVKATKILIDRAAARNVKAAGFAVGESGDLQQAEKEKVAAEVARIYISAVRAAQITQLREHERTMAEHSLGMSQARAEQHMADATELRSAHSAVNAAEQKLSAARLEEAKALLRLQYLVGADWGSRLELAPASCPADHPTLEGALAEAEASHPQLLALAAHEQYLDAKKQAVSAEKLPTLTASGDFGGNVVMPDPSGVGGPTKSITYNAVLSLQIPILDGHRRALETASLSTEQRSEHARLLDLRREVELNTRIAFATLQQASEQTKIARDDYQNAEADLAEQKANREQGNLNSIEIEQAQLHHAERQDELDGATSAEALACVDLAEAVGNVTRMSW